MLKSVIDCLHANEQQTAQTKAKRLKQTQKKCNKIRSHATQTAAAPTTKFHFALYFFFLHGTSSCYRKRKNRQKKIVCFFFASTIAYIYSIENE